MDGRMNICMYVCMDEYMDGWMNRWMAGHHFKHDPKYRTIMMSGKLIVVDSKETKSLGVILQVPPLLAYDP
jgi:hypothetical protein